MLLELAGVRGGAAPEETSRRGPWQLQSCLPASTDMLAAAASADDGQNPVLSVGRPSAMRPSTSFPATAAVCFVADKRMECFNQREAHISESQSRSRNDRRHVVAADLQAIYR